MFERIELHQPRLNAFISVTAEHALKRARLAEKEISRGNYLGPLHGIPLSLKDLIYTKGVRTTAGSKILRRFVPKEDAHTVELLTAAGAVLQGKTNLHEFAYGATNVNSHFGPVCNPWDVARMSGGSSGGSAVSVSAALSLGSLGTDTGGSIRIPAAACGCVGFKPTFGLVSLDGVIPLSPSLDHLGPLARCVEDVAILLEVIAQGNRGGLTRFTREIKRGARGLRLGVPRQYFFDHVRPEVRRSVLEAVETFRKIGARISEAKIEGTGDTAYLSSVIPVAEALAYHWKWLQKRPGDYDSAIRSRMESGKNLPAVEYVIALERRKAYRRRFEKVFDKVDVLIAPTLPTTAPGLDQAEVFFGAFSEDVRLALLRLTRPANLTGQPAISIPCGISKEGMPIGLQLIGRRQEDATVLRAAWAFEQATPWHGYFPPDDNI
jgi:aspartyl-tRNA(Asn)/glutamyl-tRNA(Gln) amidotransferase subunit A